MHAQTLRRTFSIRTLRLFSPVQLALAVVFVLAGTAFAHITEDYLTGDALVRWDVEFARWLHDGSSPALVSVFGVVTWAGNAVVLAGLAGLALLHLWRRGRRSDAFLLAGSALGIEVLNALLKIVVHRPRPELAFVHLDTYSFPSGHATGTAAVYAVLAVMLVRRAPVLAGLVYVAIVVAVGFSRLYLGVHYLSDVLAGTALGIAWAAATALVYVSAGRRATHTNSAESAANARLSNHP